MTTIRLRCDGDYFKKTRKMEANNVYLVGLPIRVFYFIVGIGSKIRDAEFFSDFFFLRNSFSCANPQIFLSLKIEQFHLYRRK
jgi:hypothetical protein